MRTAARIADAVNENQHVDKGIIRGECGRGLTRPKTACGGCTAGTSSSAPSRQSTPIPPARMATGGDASGGRAAWSSGRPPRVF